MGSRANYIITHHGIHEIFYAHWGAQKVTRDFFFGPDMAIAVVRSTAVTDQLLDDVWAEGGAVINLDRKRLRLWGGEDVGFDIGQRELWLELLALSWPDWDVAWADHGIFELADQIGIPRTDVRGKGFEAFEPNESSGLNLDHSGSPDSFVTLRNENGQLNDFLLDPEPESLIAEGPRLLEMLKAHAESAIPKEDDPLWPHLGIYFDVNSKSMWMSYGSTFDPDVDEAVSRIWPGWAVRCHTIGMPKHLALTGRDPKLFQLPAERHISSVASMIKSGDTDPGRLLRDLEKDDPTWKDKSNLNPYFLQQHGIGLTAEAREDYFLKVLSAWRATKSKEVR